MGAKKKSGSKSLTHILPPCKVCGEPGTGFHYGANTCGACKGFFRRALVRSELYECLQSPLCTVGPYTSRRLTCPRCRYDKCIAVGMSRDACKVGRYTLIKRFKDTQEAMKYQQFPSDLSTTDTDETATERLQDCSQSTSDHSIVSGSNVDTSAETSQSPDSPQTTRFSSSLSIESTPFFSKEDTVLNKEPYLDLKSSPISKEPLTTLSSSLPPSDFCLLQNVSANNTFVDRLLPPSSPDSSNIIVDANDQIYTEDSLNADSPTSNHNFLEKTSDESPHENQQLTKSIQPYNQCSSCKSNALAPASKENYCSEPQCFKIYMVAPDPMKCSLSIFEKFPFRSFEKNNLSPLLKMCYDSNEWIEDYLLQQGSESKRNLCKDHFKAPEALTTSIVKSLPVSFSGQSQQLLTSAQGVTYDATEMDNLYNNLEEIHCRYYGPTSYFLSDVEIFECREMYIKICQLHDSLKGKVNLIDDDKYFTILSSTGVDVDKRKEWFTYIFGNYDDPYTRDIKYIRALPGFMSLPLDLRVALAKTSYLYLIKLRHHKTTDYDSDIVIDQERGIAVRISTFKRILPGSLFDEWFLVCQALKSMNLTFEELHILKPAFVTIPPDDLDEAGQQILTLHNTYMKCYLHHLRKFHGPEADARFNKMISIIQAIRQIGATRLMANKSLARTINKLADGEKQILMREALGRP